MRSGLLPIVTALVRAWTRVYTLGLPRAERTARRAEIDSDLWEFEHDPEAPQGGWAATQILARLLIGIQDDLAWRIDAGAMAHHAPVRALAAAGTMTGPRRVSAFGLSAIVHVTAISAVLWLASRGPVPSPNAGEAAPGPSGIERRLAGNARIWNQLVRHEPAGESFMKTPVHGVATTQTAEALDVVSAIAVAVAARVGWGTPPHLAAQAPSSANEPSAPAIARSQAFEGISLKPARSGDPRTTRMRVLPNGDLNATAVPVLLLLHYAYDVPVNPSPRLSGLPGWRETYDIEAKAPADAVPPGLSESEKRGRLQAMIRRLLADRFKLVMRIQQKAMPVYALTVARGGPNLQTATIAEKDCFFDTGTPESCHHFIVGRGHPLNARAVTMDDLALYIENWTDLPVVNRTAVRGLFAVQTEGWVPMGLPPPPPGHPPATRFDDLPTLFTVLRTLGLELKQQEATVPVYTVEHIERPAGE